MDPEQNSPNQKRKKNSETDQPASLDFLSGGGEMGRRMRAMDWSDTLVGDVSTWPLSLKTAISIMLNSDFPMFIWWGSNAVHFYNDAYIPVLGKTKHPQWLGGPANECWSDIWDVIGPMYQEVMFTGKPLYFEDLILFMDRNIRKEEVYFTFSYSPIRNDLGAIGGMYCACTETTSRVFGERQMDSLRELASRTVDAKSVEEACMISVQTLQRNSKDVLFSAIYLLDTENQTLRLEASAGFDEGQSLVFPRELTKTEPAVWPLFTVLETQDAALVKDLNEHFPSLLNGGWDDPPQEAMVMPVVQSRGAFGVFVVALNPLRVLDADYKRYLQMASGQIAAAVSTARAYQEERLRAKALAELDRAKTVFFSNISHEFRTPLTLMLGPLEEALADLEISQDIRKNIELAHRNGLRLQKLVNNLLDFSRIEAGRIKATYIPTDISSYTTGLASNFRSAIEKAGMQLLVNAPKVSERVYLDKDMWEKIILNLLSNAFKFTLQGHISVSIEENQSSVCVIVSDTGEGISSEDLPHIFERFKRVEGAKSRSNEGSGIGLSMVKELVSLHKGTISVRSKLKEGTTFTIELPKGTAHLPKEHIGTQPLAEVSTVPEAFLEEAWQWLPENVLDEDTDVPEGMGPKATGNGNKPVTGSRPRIVLADDNADMRQYIQRLLHDKFDLLPVVNGKAALEAVRKYKPDLVLSDVMMPEMDGLELLRSLKSNLDTADIPVILLSARAGEEARVEGVKAGANDYLFKPFGANELIARVNAVVAAKQAREQTDDMLREIFMQAPAFIAMLKGPQHIFELCNPLYMLLVGTERDILGKPAAEALPEVVDQGFIELLDGVFQTGKPYIGNEVPVDVDKHETGQVEKVYVNFVYQPYKDTDGAIRGIFVHGVDVTEQVENRRKIEGLLRQKDEFIGIASHELKTPVASIRGYTEVLEHKFSHKNDRMAVDMLRKMRGQVDRLNRLITDLLDVTRVEQGRLMLRKELFDLNELVSEVVEDMQNTSAQHKIVMQSGKTLMVHGDRERLGQVLINFLSNAIKYSPKASDIIVRSEAAPDSSEAIVSVQDFGIGLTSEEQERLFERFYRAQNMKTFPGLGLGLYIAAEIIARHEGRIWAHSKKGKGSTFYFALPVKQ